MLLLFQKENCSYCADVRAALSRLHVSYVAVNSIIGSPARELQLKWGDLDQVPFLVDIDKGLRMYESDMIISYLEKTYGE